MLLHFDLVVYVHSAPIHIALYNLHSFYNILQW